MKRLLPSALALCALAFPLAAHPQDTSFPEQSSSEIDRGSFNIYQSGKYLGSEAFALFGSGDSMLVSSRCFQVLPGGDTLRKNVAQVVGLLDYGLRSYLSQQLQGGHSLYRGVRLEDTVFATYRQVDQRGDSDWLVLPPGRMFVMDPKVFVCFDLICRSLHGKAFDQRPLKLFVLGPSDTVLDVKAADLGSETLRWGSGSIQARKLSIADATTSFTVWASPRGYLVRLVESASGLRVERIPPAVKPAASKPKPAG